MIDLTELYVEIDDFCRKVTEDLKGKLVGSDKAITIDTPGLTLSEVLTILVFYHFSHFDCIKHYYLIRVQRELKKYFTKVPSYNRFIERIKEVPSLAEMYLQYKQVKYNGEGYIDSTPLKSVLSHIRFLNLKQN